MRLGTPRARAAATSRALKKGSAGRMECFQGEVGVRQGCKEGEGVACGAPMGLVECRSKVLYRLTWTEGAVRPRLVGSGGEGCGFGEQSAQPDEVVSGGHQVAC
jgi:hypothetical protein